jgi:aspartyl-tRNA(Asn)/glutamyl-tRNA(Gln) amidotransferase subunit A
MSAIPLTVQDAAAGLRAGDLSSVELTRAMLARADRLDGRLGTYLARFDERALAAAAAADAELAAGVDRGPLHGVPVAVKDILAAREGPTTAQSLVLDPDWGAGKDAPVVARLRAAGAVITGKTTTAEFACGMPDPTKPFPIPRNPWDLRAYPGGSSSGTGSGVAAGLFLAGVGTDTGGSIRMPAGYCGISGLKATFGRVPKSGCTPLGYSLDHVGPMARSAWDCAAMLQVMAGHHPSDPDSATTPVPDYLEALAGSGSLAGLRVGVDREHHFPEDADPDLRRCFDAAVTALERLGAALVDVSLPYWHELNTATMLILAAEGAAYHRPDLVTRWDDYFLASRALLARGSAASGADVVQAHRVRRVAQRSLGELFTTVDVVVGPTAAGGAIGYDDDDRLVAIDQLVRGIFTPYWNATGSPALVVPMGFTRAGLPLSLQLAGRPFEEALLFRVGDAYQRATDWHRRVPPVLAELEAVA